MMDVLSDELLMDECMLQDTIDVRHTGVAGVGGANPRLLQHTIDGRDAAHPGACASPPFGGGGPWRIFGIKAAEEDPTHQMDPPLDE